MSDREAELFALTVPKLKERLRKKKLPVSGKKAVLVQRLLDAEDEGPSKPKAKKKTPKKKAAAKKGRKRTPKKSPRKSPTESAAKHDVGTEKVGNDDNLYIVAERKNGVHYWKKCSYEGAACTMEPIVEEEVVEVETEFTVDDYNKLVEKKVPQLKKMVAKEYPEYSKLKLLKNQLVMLLLTGILVKRGGTPRKNKIPDIEPEAGEKPKRPSTPKTPRRKSKGKEPAKAKPKAKPKKALPKNVEPAGEIKLDGWVAIGEMEILFEFLKQFSDEDSLMARIEEKNEDGYVRLEPDPTCDVSTGLCGSQAIGVNFRDNSYDLFEERTKADYLSQLYVGAPKELEKANLLADFGLIHNLAVGDISDFYALVKPFGSFKELLSKKNDNFVDPTIANFANPPRARGTHLMNVTLLKSTKGSFKGAHIRRKKR